MEYPFLLMVTMLGNTFPLLVYGIDYNDACSKIFLRYPNDTPVIQNATIE